jgi:predicted membrane protein
MEPFSTAIFWGIVIALIGISIIMKEVFQVSFPFFRILIGVFLLWLGVKVMFGIRFKNTEHSIAFENRTLKYDKAHNEYQTVFGNATFDFTDVVVTDQTVKVEVKAIFSGGTVVVNTLTPVELKMSTAFGQVQSPGNSANGFGNNSWVSPGCDLSKPHLVIEASAVFGRLELQTR